MAVEGWRPVLLVVSVLGVFTFSAVANTVQVSVYYESMCPDSERFFQEQLTPTYKKIPSYVNLELIPYGNAHYRGKPDEYTFTCQHGPEECYGNMVQSCFIELVNDTVDNLKFINCAFQSPSQLKIIQLCIESRELQAQVKKCVESPMGNNLEYQMAKKTDSLYPPKTFIPWITINGKGGRELNDKAFEDLMTVICGEFTDEKPDACQKTRQNVRPYGQYL